MEAFYFKYKELIIFFIGFVMTSLVGSYVAFEFQNRSWENQHKVELIDYERQQAIQVFLDISSIMDNRLYKMRKVYWGKRFDVDQNVLDSRNNKYDEILDIWNSNLNKNLALLERYFGVKNRYYFEFILHKNFFELSKKISFLKVNSFDDEFNIVNKEIDDLNSYIYKFDKKLLNSIR